MILIILFLLIFAPSAIAEELYAVERPDGSVAIANYIGGSSDSLEDFLASNGLLGLPMRKITRADLQPREERNYWKPTDAPTGKKVIVDQLKKKADEDAKAAKEADRNAVLAKLKITKEEHEKLNAKI